jgi:hypothetical protein
MILVYAAHRMKTKLSAIGLAAVSLLGISACSFENDGLYDSGLDNFTNSKLAIDSTGWRCEQFDDYIACETRSFDGAAEWESQVYPQLNTQWAALGFGCPSGTNKSGSVYLTAGPRADGITAEYFNWNPVSFPNVEIHLDSEVLNLDYTVQTTSNGSIMPEFMNIEEPKKILDKLIDVQTVTLVATDSSGTEREFSFSNSNFTSSIEAIEAWGFDCNF